ncbi:substrate-binding domain-containing protein [candidate division KSB1 bacterium]|nr:substrate-binding domain-containing protein [candidate division KSB1 bacterium]
MVKIAEIAKRANVSVGTVDRVIHNRGRVSKETEKKVRQIIEELNYKPNILARSLSLSKDFRFGVLMPKINADNYYWEQAIKGINKAQKELRVHKVSIMYFHYEGYSETSFRNTSNKALNAHLDGLLIVPTIYKSVDDEFVRKIPANLPYVFFNSNIPSSNYLSYIGQDSYQSGVMAGNLMRTSIHGPGTVAVLTMLHDDYHINKRLKGFETVFESDDEIKIKIYGAQRTEDKLTFEKILNDIFQENEDLVGVFVTTALTYRVAEYIKDYSPKNQIRIIGYDLTNKNVLYLKEGLIDFLIGQRPEMQGYHGIYSLYRKIILKEEVDRQIMMPLDIITKANIEYYHRYYLS